MQALHLVWNPDSASPESKTSRLSWSCALLERNFRKIKPFIFSALRDARGIYVQHESTVVNSPNPRIPASIDHFWSLAGALELTPAEQMLTLWAHTNERAGVLGLYYCPTKEISGGALPNKDIVAAMTTLEKHGLVYFCPDTLYLWAALRPEWSLNLRGGSLKPSDNRRVAIQKQWAKCPSQRLKTLILEHYGERIGLSAISGVQS